MFTLDIPKVEAPALTDLGRLSPYRDQYGTAIDGVVPFLAIINAADPRANPTETLLVDAIQRTDNDRRKRAKSIGDAQRLADPLKIFASEQYQLVVYDDHPKLIGVDLKTCDFAQLLQSFGVELFKVDGGTRHLAHRNLAFGHGIGKKKIEPRPEFEMTPVKVCLHIIPRGLGLFLQMFTHFNSERTKISPALMDLIRGAKFAWEEDRAKNLVGEAAAESAELRQNAKKNEIIAMLADPAIHQFAGMVLMPGESDDAIYAKKQAGSITNSKLAAAIDGCIKTAKWNDGEFGRDFHSLSSAKLVRIFRGLVEIVDQCTEGHLFEHKNLRRWFSGAFNTMFVVNVSAAMLLVKLIYNDRKAQDDSYTVSQAVSELWRYKPDLEKMLKGEMQRPEAKLRYSGETSSAARQTIWTAIKKDIEAIKL
jgi:hypothetical protein